MTDQALEEECFGGNFISKVYERGRLALFTFLTGKPAKLIRAE